VDSVCVWLRLLRILELPPGASVFELAPGGDDALMRALAQHDQRAQLASLDFSLRTGSEPHAFGAASLSLRVLLSHLRERVKVCSVDLIAFRHAVEDIVQAAVAQEDATDPFSPTQGDRPAPLRALRAYWRSGDLERVVVPQFLEIVKACCVALRPGGQLLFSHQVLDCDLSLGHPLELYADYIPLARRWIATARLPLREIVLNEFDPHWWLCLQRTK